MVATNRDILDHLSMKYAGLRHLHRTCMMCNILSHFLSDTVTYVGKSISSSDRSQEV